PDFGEIGASDDQTTGRLRSAMPFVHLPEKIFELERLALARVERPDALVDLRSELAEPLDMHQQSPATLFLICFRQARHLGVRLFETFDHASRYHNGIAPARTAGC